MDDQDLSLASSRLKDARGHFALLITFVIFSFLLFVGRTMLQWGRITQLPEKISNTLFTLTFGANIGNIVALAYKVSVEISKREDVVRMLKEGGKADSKELDMMLVGPKWIRLGWFVALFYIVELWLLKGAFIAFYWGLFSKVHTRLRFLLYSTIFLVVTTFIILLILYLSWCTPIERNWTAPIIEHRKCGFNPSRTAQTIQTAFNMSTDILIMLIPLSILNSLRLGTHEKFALAFVFTIGGFIVVASGIRYGIVIKSLSQNYNLQTIRDMERWSVVECTMALLAFCLPALRRMVVRVFGVGRRMGSGERESEGRVGGSGAYAKGNWFDSTAVGKVYSVEATRIDPAGRKGSEEAIELRAKTTRGPGESQEWLRSV